MTSRNAQKLQYSDAANVDNAMINHKHHRHHEPPGAYPNEVEYNPEKPQRLPAKHKHRHEHKVNVDGLYDVQNHPIQSISGLLRNERHHGRKSKIYNSGDQKISNNNAIIKTEDFCENCQLPKLSESGENTKNDTLDNVLNTSKHVQTSKTKLKQKRVKGEEVKHYHSKSTISRNIVGKSKREVYIITGEDTLFKFTTLSQEKVHSKHKRHSDSKEQQAIDTKPEENGSTNYNTKPGIEQNSQDCMRFMPKCSSEFIKAAQAMSLISKDKNTPVQDTIIEQKNRASDDSRLKSNDIISAHEVTRQSYSKHRERHSYQPELDSKKRKDKSDFPKVISTKLKHRQKKSDVTLTDRTKSSEERLQKRYKREHRHKHLKNNDFALPLENLCGGNLPDSKDITALLNKPNLDLTSDELEHRRKKILDNIEKAYSKHKHILPKEVVEALDGNIKQWRSMDMEASKKSSDQMSNVLDLEEVLKKNKKSKLHFREHHSEKITTTASESTLPSGLKKTTKPQNDLILLNAIVTGINNIDCDKDTVHVNKIPKFVRLEEIECEPDTMTSKRVLSKISVIQKCASDSKDHLDKYSAHGAIPKTSRVLHTPVSSNEDVRKEVSFSELNVQPAISLYSVNNQKGNCLNGCLPTLLRDKIILKSKRRKTSAEKKFLNLFMKKEARDDKKLSRISIDPIVTFANEDSMFNVEGVEPPKKHKPNIPSAFITRKIIPSLKRLELVVLPVLEITSCFDKAQSVCDAALSTSKTEVLKKSKPYLRKKENHRIQKTPGLSASSSESTVQLKNLPDGRLNTQPAPDKPKLDPKKQFMTDKEAIEALKYLPLHQKECSECSPRLWNSKKKLEKIILSTVEIRSEIPAQREKSTLNINKLEAKPKTQITFKETEGSTKRNQNLSPKSVLDTNLDRTDDAIPPLGNLVNEKSLEDYVTKDKCDEKKSYNKKGSHIPCLNLNASRKSTQSICSSLDDRSQSKKTIKTAVDGHRVRARMLSYSKNVEQRRKYSRGSTGSSRDTSNEGDPQTFNVEDKTKKRSPSLSVISISSCASANSESDKQSEKAKSTKPCDTKNNTMVTKGTRNLMFKPVPIERTDKGNPASETVSAALTKITEETISQDTLIGSDFSQYSKKETESKLPKLKPRNDRSLIMDKFPKPSLRVGTKISPKEDVKKSDTSSIRSGRIPRHVDLSSVKQRGDGSNEKKGLDQHERKGATRLDSKLSLKSNTENRRESKDNTSSKDLKTEELNILTESVKKIITEMQAINTTNIQTMMQLIMNKKEETNRTSVEEIIAKNLGNVLKNNALDKQGGDKQTCRQSMEKISVPADENINKDFNQKPLNKMLGEVSDCGSTKSSRSRKSDRTNYSVRSAKILENKNFGFRKRKPPNSLKASSLRGYSTESQKSDSLSNAPIYVGEKSLDNSKTKTVSRVARSIPRSIPNKNSNKSNKPVSAPSGFDRNKMYSKVKSITPSMDSDTRTSLLSTRVGSAKESSRQTVTKPAVTISKFERRKQYSESLRKKMKNDNLGSVNNQVCFLGNAGDNVVTVTEPVEKTTVVQVDSPFCNCSYQEASTGLLEAHDSYNEANSMNDTKYNEFNQEQSNQDEPEVNFDQIAVNVDIGLSVPTFIRSVKSETQLNQQPSNYLDETVPKESENIYQTFTVMADHPNIIDVFRNKFEENTSSYSIEQDSFCSPLSRFSANSDDKTNFSTLKEPENDIRVLEKVSKSIGVDGKSIDIKNENGLVVSYQICDSTPEIIYSTNATSITQLDELSRMKINILETCQHLCKNDDTKSKYVLYSPYTCSRKIPKLIEKDYSLPAFHKYVDTNLHRCKHKFNIHSMLKINRTADDCCNWYCRADKFSSHRYGTRPKHININSCSNINDEKRNSPVKASRFVQRSDYKGQGNYVVFKIDKNLELRKQNHLSPKDASRECFKIFMNNNVHNMQWDSDYPLRFSKYDFKSKFFYDSNYYVNQRPVSETGESGYDSSDGKESRNLLRSLSESIDVSKNSYSTVITFPFNIHEPNKLGDVNPSQILSPERDNEVVIRINDPNSNLQIEELCESVTNARTCSESGASNGPNPATFGSSFYGTDATAYFYNDERSKRGGSNHCERPHCSKNEKPMSSNRSSCHNKSIQTNTEAKCKYQYDCRSSRPNCSSTDNSKRSTIYLHATEARKNKSESQCGTRAHTSKNENFLYTNRSSCYKPFEANKIIKSQPLLVNCKNTQTFDTKRQVTTDPKKVIRRNKVQTDDSTDCDTAKNYDNKLVQTSIKRKHKRIPPEFTSRSTSYESIVANDDASVFENKVNRNELLESLLSNPAFQELLTGTIKNILVDTKVLPTHSTEEIIKSLVRESISSMKKTPNQVVNNPPPSTDQQSATSKFSIEVVEKNAKDLQVQLTTKLMVQHKASLIFEEFINDLLMNIIKKIVEIKESFKLSVEKESKNKTEELPKTKEKSTSITSFYRKPGYQLLDKDSSSFEKGKLSTSDESLQSGRKPLTVEEKKSLITDLKSFKTSLTNLSRSIRETSSNERILEYCSLKSTKWKLIHKTTLKSDSSTSTKHAKKNCECSSSQELESNELLKIMAKLPLTTLMSLYKKVSDCNDPAITFESLIRELYEAEAKKNLGEYTTHELPSDSTVTVTKVKQLNQKHRSTPLEKSDEKEKKLTYESKSGKKSNHDNQKEMQSAPGSSNQDKSDKENSKSLGDDRKKTVSETVLNLSDKQIFKKLLDSFEKEEAMVHKLSTDDEFLKSQLETVKNKESIEYLLRQPNIPENNKSYEDVVQQLEDILEQADSSIKFNKYEKKATSRFSSLKTKMTRLFKNSSRDLRGTISGSRSSNRRSSIEEFIGKDGKIHFSKSKAVERYKREETSLSSDDSNYIKPQEIGKYFMRGFREDQMLLSSASTSKGNDQRDDTSLESFVELSEKDNALDYLLALGYSIEEASRAIKDEDVENRLNAAIIEARVWVNQVTSTQGTLLYLLAYKAKPKIMRYYLQLIEAIINNRINNAVKLDSFLRVLEKVEDGDISMLYVLGSDIFQEEENEEYLLKKQLRKVFHDVYHVARYEARKRGKELTKDDINLLKLLSAKYRSGLSEHLEIIAQYIGRGLLKSQVQLEAAMIYFSRLDSSEYHATKFEKYCGIKSKE